MTMNDYWANVEKLSVEVAIQEVQRARKKAQVDMDADTRDFFNPSVETNPYKRASEAHMAEAYTEERLLLIETWSRNNGH